MSSYRTRTWLGSILLLPLLTLSWTTPPQPADADAIVLEKVLTFHVKGPGKATRIDRHSILVNNANGRDEAGELYIKYNKFKKIKKLEGRLLDAEGQVIRKLKKDDIEDYSAVSNNSLFDDSRVRVAELYHHTYPYTVEFETKIEYNGLIGWPTWYPQDANRLVLSTRFELNVPAQTPVRYQNNNIDVEPVVKTQKKRTIYTWSLSGLLPWESESYGPVWAEQAPTVMTAPARFEIEGRPGDMSSWTAFGHWYYTLNAERDHLIPAEQHKVQALTADAKTDREKAERLYGYMQESTRYVSIQLGIGGWQTLPAGDVCENRYGDCKALTNFMYAMLKAVGIKSYPALVKAGTRVPRIRADFPSNQFNHVILAIPTAADTTWLECTSQTLPFGHLGTFTEDRNVLLITPEGGKLVRTPKTRPADNRQIRSATVKLHPTGDATASINTRYTGNQQDRVHSALLQTSAKDRETWLRETLDVPSFKLTATDFSSVDARGPKTTLPISLELPRYATRSGTRLFFQPNLLERWSHIPDALDMPRVHPVRAAPFPYIDVDTVYYHIPKGYQIEAAPEKVNLKTDFGWYFAEIKPDDPTTLRYVRYLKMEKTWLPAGAYEAYRNFIKTIVQTDQSRIVLVRRKT